MQINSLNFLELPETLIEQVLSYLTFHELECTKKVSKLLFELSENLFRDALRKSLKLISSKIRFLQDVLNYRGISFGEKMILNQILTRLEMLKFNVNSLFILNRHSLRTMDFSMLGKILDEIAKLAEINTLDTHWYLEKDPIIQNILKDFSSLTSQFQKQPTLPFGVYIMDILDLLLGINFSKTIKYKLKDNSCSIKSCYYTNNSKFLLYLPDFTFMKNCQNRRLNVEEQQGILKYLLVIVNLYNGLFSKNEEYRREMEMRTTGKFTPEDLFHIVTEAVFDSELEMIVERKEKFLTGSPKNEKGLLLCEMFLECQLNEAPFEVMKSFETLKKDVDVKFVFKDVKGFVENSYGVRIKLKITIQHKNTEEFEINILDGIQLDKTE